MPQAKQTTTQAVDSNPMVAQAIHQAKVLEYERGTLMERIDANRQLLRLLDQNEMVDEATGTWLDRFYPTKGRGVQRSREDVEDTRKAKLEARKEVATERGEDTPTADESGDDE